MKVFISWSGDQSKAVAETIRKWIPSVLQAVRPYFSPDDITKGSRWSAEIAGELNASRIGLLIVTRENQNAPWMVFEAGALAKNLDRAKVCPILIDGLEATDLSGPLVQFQSARFQKEEIKRVVRMINTELGEAALATEVLDNVFEMWWPRLEQDVTKAIADHRNPGAANARTDRDMLEEVLALTRETARDRMIDGNHPAWDDLYDSMQGLVRACSVRSGDEELQMLIRTLLGPLEHIAVRSGGRNMRRHRGWRELSHVLEKAISPPTKAPPVSPADGTTSES